MVKKSKSEKRSKLKRTHAKAKSASDVHVNEDELEERGKKLKDAKSGMTSVAAGNEDLLFEDPFEDEFEEEHLFRDDTELPDDFDEENDSYSTKQMEVSKEVESNAGMDVRTFRPGVDSALEGEEMVHDPSAYHMYHSLRPEWPCLSFDFLVDKLGPNRLRYPHTVYAVSGTQAARGESNKIQIMKLADLHKTQKTHADDDDDDDDDDEDSDDDYEDTDPTLEHIDVPHQGAINRIRSMTQNPGIIAAWSEQGFVSLVDISKQISALEKGSFRDSNAPTLHCFKGHANEGFAMDWSKVSDGHLVTGCCGGRIYIHDPHEGGIWKTHDQPCIGHTGSVEDLQWSPTEKTVFGSTSADGSIGIWDTRKPVKPMITLPLAHAGTDVNVMSWNRNITYLLATGGDDGSFKVWDLRTFGKGIPDPVAQFSWHRAPITSLEWDPSDESMLAVAGADNQVTVWDLSVEADDGDLVAGPNKDCNGIQDLKLPPQLLFVHQGQDDVKELHYHPQITGVIMTTALDGFNLWKPATVLQGEEK